MGGGIRGEWLLCPRRGSVFRLITCKYSEIVWLPMGRIASTSTNADALTGSGSPEELPLRAPTDPGVTVSRYRAPLALAFLLAVSTMLRLPIASAAGARDPGP